MAIIFDKKPKSGTWNVAKGTGVHEYQLIGTANEFPAEVDAAAHVESVVPIFYEGAWIQDIQVTPQGNGLYYVSCPYGPLPRMPGTTQTPSIKIGFRTTGGTVHISSSREMVAKYGTGATDRVIIGQDGAGADITVPAQMRSYTFNFPKGIVTEVAMDYWEDLGGAVNSSVWHYRPAGEVLFLGAEGDTTIAADYNSSVTFHFAMSRNKTNQTIGSITGIAKEGHDLIDIHTKTEVISAEDVQVEKYVFIQRVYERLNFFTYLGF
jgi:hypothetical protein